MVSFPPCKINLGLQVIRKRPDGFHDLSSCFYPIPWTDIVEVIPASTFSFTSSGISIPGSDLENLCVHAFHLISKDFDLPQVNIHLHKIIPIGAGLGGGSSDAAHVLRLINSIFKLNLTNEELFNYTSKLGSDCSFFIQDEPMLAHGRGEILTEITLQLKGKHIIILKPNVHVSTAEAYSGIIPKPVEISIDGILQKPITAWKELLKNDFEDSVFKKYPVIRFLKDSLYMQGAVYASMSGSGSAVFGIFEKEIEFKNEINNVISWSGVL